MMAGVVVFSTLTSSLGSIMSSFDKERAQINERLLLINNVCDMFEIGKAIKDELKESIRFEYNKKRDEMRQLMDVLSSSLYEKLAMEIHKSLESKFYRFF